MRPDQLGHQVSPPQGKRNRSLKNLLINPGFQLKYVFWIGLTGVLLILTNAGLVYSYVRENYEAFMELAPMTAEAKNQLYSELNALILRLSTISLAFVFLILVVGVFFSHRVAGPLYRMKLTFREIAGGKHDQRVRLRPRDEFKDVAEEFNRMMDQVESNHRPNGPLA